MPERPWIIHRSPRECQQKRQGRSFSGFFSGARFFLDGVGAKHHDGRHSQERVSLGRDVNRRCLPGVSSADRFLPDSATTLRPDRARVRKQQRRRRMKQERQAKWMPGFALAAGCLAALAAARGADIAWTNAAGGDFSNPLNWSPSPIPWPCTRPGSRGRGTSAGRRGCRRRSGGRAACRGRPGKRDASRPRRGAAAGRRPR